jgi:ATP-binding protein involved in chromosome partitioning
VAESLTQAAVLQALRSIQDFDLHRDNVSLGFVKDVTTSDGKVALTIELTTPACPGRDPPRSGRRGPRRSRSGASSRPATTPRSP